MFLSPDLQDHLWQLAFGHELFVLTNRWGVERVLQSWEDYTSGEGTTATRSAFLMFAGRKKRKIWDEKNDFCSTRTRNFQQCIEGVALKHHRISAHQEPSRCSNQMKMNPQSAKSGMKGRYCKSGRKVRHSILCQVFLLPLYNSLNMADWNPSVPRALQKSTKNPNRTPILPQRHEFFTQQQLHFEPTPQSH